MSRKFLYRKELEERGEIMKKDIHPEYTTVEVHCSCGNTFETRSTKGKDIALDVCSECHPFYNNADKSVSKDGRAEMFKKKYGLE